MSVPYGSVSTTNERKEREMSAMKTLATALNDGDKLTHAERDLFLAYVLAYAETKAGKPYAHAYMLGMVQTILTDDQIRRLFRIAQD